MQILAVIAVIVFGAEAVEIALFDKCTLCDVAETLLPVSLDIDDYSDTLCPGEELEHVPGTMDCKLVTVPRRVP